MVVVEEREEREEGWGGGEAPPMRVEKKDLE